VVDESGTAGIFHIENTPIEPGQMYAILVADNRVARYVPSAQILANSDNSFVRWLFSDGDKSLGDDMYEVVAFQTHTTKAGKKMAYVVFADSEKEMVRALAFPQNFHKAYSRCHEGQAVGVRFGQTDDGTIYIEDCF
jgi:DNA polymerase III subunit alpha